MSTFKNIVLAGATGNLGPTILEALESSGKFNITVFRRQGSSSKVPSSVKVVDIDYNSIDALTKALQGQDAVVSTLVAEDPKSQSNLIAASVAAGVKRFLPSEFGCDIENPQAAKLPVFASKIDTSSKLKELSKTTSLSYTLVRTGPFLDWGLRLGFIFDAKNGKPNIYDNGNVKFSATLLSDIGKTVVGVLTHPGETKNRAVLVKSIDVSLNELLAIAKKVYPDTKFDPQYLETKDVAAKSFKDLESGNATQHTFMMFILVAVFAEGYGGQFETVDNELFGIKTISENELAEIWKKL